ncbi:HAD-IB family phosphatase [Ruania rhizosphaerae]|uniref:HAD-IB family phosphatase n=1 Tax=Ruania rhizosphaerae TaxID=1840413 RepID=UPI001F1A9642|nr:HAD-IB family phosphatase [Ruania rhizosphaerae]
MSDPLKNAHVLVTGATGFVGQAVVEKLLATYPTTRITLLVRPRGALTAEDRVRKLLKKPVFGPWRERIGADTAEAQLAERITVLAGDLGDVPPLPTDLTHVVHSASTVSFDLPIDEAFAANVGGPVSLYEALEATGADPHVVHVSTCYVAGLRKGLAEERSLDHDVDRRVETTRALRARESAEAASRRPQVLDKIVAKARATHRRAGAQAVAQAAEEARRAWVNDQLVTAGRTRATSLGWPDVYTFTKALGERVAEDLWAGAGHRLSIVRPTIIESSLQHPFPGWIDGFKVADPLIAAYGRGMLPEFPALADSILDVIPVDHVVNAILAAAASPPEVAEEPDEAAATSVAPHTRAAYYQVASGSRNPLRFGTILRLLREYFEQHPLTGDDGSFVQVPNWTFPHGPAVQRSLRRREMAVDLADSLVGKLPPNETTRSWISSVYKAKRDLGTLRKFTDLYQAYTQTEVVFDDTHTHALHEAVPAERSEEHGFDVSAIDWTYYMKEVHVPKVPGLMRARRPHNKPSTSAKSLPQREDVLAVFDLHGTVASASLIEHYVWVELAAKGAVPALRGLGGMVASSGTYLQAEWRDRGDFIRSFMRRYAGVDEAVLREVIATKVTPSLRARLLAEATERIALHRAAGHRTVLVSGQIDVFVEPLADMFDVIVAGQMEKDSGGRWTGHLATSPLVDEARASWLRRYAREEGMDLAGSYAYGDTYADRPWLEVAGKPNVVNPDATLYRYAREKRWPVHSWTTTAEGRFSPVLRSLGSRR